MRAILLMICLAGLCILAAAALGWLHAGSGYGAPVGLTLHRWLGTAAAVGALGTALLSEWDERRGTRSPWFRASLFVGALLVGAAAHFGGTLVHGEDFLAFG